MPDEEPTPSGATVVDAAAQEAPFTATRREPSTLDRIARQFVRDEGGFAALPTKISAQLRRTDPSRFGEALGALMPVLVGAGVSLALPNETQEQTAERLQRWALVVHIVALLAGTGGAWAHRHGIDAGRAIHAAGYSETRFMRLLAARGPALADQVTRLARFLAAKGQMPLDLSPLADLILYESDDEARAEAARLRLARGYYGAEAARERKAASA